MDFIQCTCKFTPGMKKLILYDFLNMNKIVTNEPYKVYANRVIFDINFPNDLICGKRKEFIIIYWLPIHANNLNRNFWFNAFKKNVK